MKKLLLLTLIVLSSFISGAQCDPSHTFHFSPNTLCNASLSFGLNPNEVIFIDYYPDSIVDRFPDHLFQLYRSPRNDGSITRIMHMDSDGRQHVSPVSELSIDTSQVDNLPRFLSGSVSLDFPSTAAGQSSDLIIVVAGAAIGDPVYAGTPTSAVLANTSYSTWVSSTDTVTVRFNNYSLVSADPSAGSFKVSIIK